MMIHQFLEEVLNDFLEEVLESQKNGLKGH
jgi:hypothetical protein